MRGITFIMFGLNTRKIGGEAEKLAEEYLRKQGYQILARNFTIRGGEIDLVALDGTEMVFVEVKARKSQKYGKAIESITPWKLKALKKSALFYIQNVGWGNKPYRFDLLAMDFSEDHSRVEYELVKNITF